MTEAEVIERNLAYLKGFVTGTYTFGILLMALLLFCVFTRKTIRFRTSLMAVSVLFMGCFYMTGVTEEQLTKNLSSSMESGYVKETTYGVRNVVKQPDTGCFLVMYGNLEDLFCQDEVVFTEEWPRVILKEATERLLNTYGPYQKRIAYLPH
ncbi:hypothetical protein IMZ31_23415 (plasmid) [Pontibacillus sp. ALD_SL1]|uniref:hypothetical protein n=1 Tax=Pontibacillus sp. ALD_SL1 TaxID=2777185 RepID=UPI001A96E3E7|nr:hypothetical protein [Pontibacillus sp. ALD_SL1]QST02402.1 hypothetical protein IMZ31_23415 [Pontibacillus sp. ALD_SL1]